jgi:rubrerythrin
MISPEELYILSYYRACELAGAVLFGKLALHTEHDAYRSPLTRHALEEARHAWAWTETIAALGSRPLKVTRTYQSEYGKRLGLPQDIIELFCLTQVFEKRSVAHYQRHLGIEKAPELVKKTLQQMIDDEAYHLDWIRVELDRYGSNGRAAEVAEAMRRFHQMDEVVYAEMIRTPPFAEYFGETP